jgi:hypothetical protein
MKRFHFEFGLASLDTYFRNIVFAFRTMLMPGIPVMGSVRFEEINSDNISYKILL